MHAQDWFHYECVGLRAPGDLGGEEEIAPEEFRCPICCMKVRFHAQNVISHSW